MKRIGDIVVPVDFSENCEKLVDYAVYMATALSAKLHCIHVVDILPGDAMLGMPISAEFMHKYESEARERMDELVGELEESSPGSTGLVVTGEVVKEIVTCAESLDADLIIISTHGSKGMESILLGSVARRVVKHAHCPVLVMNPFRKRKH